MVRLKKNGKQESVTGGLQERREQRGGDAEGEPRQRTEEAEAHFLGAVSPIQAVSVDATWKQQNRFISTLSQMTWKRQEENKKNQTHLFESYANEVYLVG